VNGEEILKGRGMRIRRDPGSTAEVERAHVSKAPRGANGGPPHIHLFQEGVDASVGVSQKPVLTAVRTANGPGSGLSSP